MMAHCGPLSPTLIGTLAPLVQAGCTSLRAWRGPDRQWRSSGMVIPGREVDLRLAVEVVKVQS